MNSSASKWKRIIVGSIVLVGIVALIACSSRPRYTDHLPATGVSDGPTKMIDISSRGDLSAEYKLSELKKVSKELKRGKSVKPSELAKMIGKPAVRDGNANGEVPEPPKFNNGTHSPTETDADKRDTDEDTSYATEAPSPSPHESSAALRPLVPNLHFLAIVWWLCAA